MTIYLNRYFDPNVNGEANYVPNHHNEGHLYDYVEYGTQGELNNNPTIIVRELNSQKFPNTPVN